MNRFSNKRVLVTGGSSGIGLAAAIAYAREGAEVVITGRDPKGLQSALAQLPANARAIESDAGSLGAARKLATELASIGAFDAVFVNAGVAEFASFDQVDETMWDRSFDINVKGPYFLLQALRPLLAKGAAIVLNGSINAHIGMPGSSVYAATKAALISLARTLSAELLPQSARVNVISPGPVTTPLHTKLGIEGTAKEAMTSQIPLGRFGTAEEIAATVLHLSAAESAYMVGTEVIVDGGMSQL